MSLTPSRLIKLKRWKISRLKWKLKWKIFNETYQQNKTSETRRGQAPILQYLKNSSFHTLRSPSPREAVIEIRIAKNSLML